MRWIPVLVFAALVTACGSGSDAPEPEPEPEPAAEEHEEGHAAHDPQYGGTLIELGAHEANIEIVLDAEAGKLTAYLWDAHVTGPARSDMKSIEVTCGQGTFQLLPVANELTGETVGDTSKFEVTDEKLRGAKEVEGTIASLELMGLSFTETEFHAE